MNNKYIFTKLAVFLFFGTASHAAIYYIDFDTSGYSGYPDASTWNIYDAPVDVTGSLVDSTGAASSHGISLSGSIADGSTHATGTDGPAWLFNSGSYYNTEGDEVTGTNAYAAYDSFTTTTTATIEISGLSGVEFSLDFHGGGTYGGTAESGLFTYSLDGGTTWNGFTAYNANGTVRVSDTSSGGVSDYRARQGVVMSWPVASDEFISLSSGDVLMIQATVDTANATQTGINAMMLTTVPEPSTYALMLGICTFGLVMLRRRLRSL